MSIESVGVVPRSWGRLLLLTTALTASVSGASAFSNTAPPDPQAPAAHSATDPAGAESTSRARALADRPRADGTHRRAGLRLDLPDVDLAQVRCPVTREPASAAAWRDFRGRRIYFASEAAARRFDSDPFGFITGVQVQEDAVVPLRRQVMCPMTRKPVDKRFTAAWHSRTVHFSSAEARTKFEALDDAEQLKRLSGCFTYQARCIKTDKAIDPQVSRVVTLVDLRFLPPNAAGPEPRSAQIFFFCPYCRADFDKDPSKFLPRYRDLVRASRSRLDHLASTTPAPTWARGADASPSQTPTRARRQATREGIHAIDQVRGDMQTLQEERESRR